MKKPWMWIVGALCVGLSLGVAQKRAAAVSDTALAGYARGADRACFGESWGAMVNNCSTTKQLFISAPIDKHCINGSSWSVSARSDNSSANVCCRAIGTWNDGRISAGSFRCLSQFGSTQRFTVNGPPVWADYAFFVCDVGPGARIAGVDWDSDGSC